MGSAKASEKGNSPPLAPLEKKVQPQNGEMWVMVLRVTLTAVHGNEVRDMNERKIEIFMYT